MLNKILKTFNYYQFSDYENDNISKVFDRIKNYYLDDVEAETKFQDIFTGVGPIKSIFKRSNNVTIPWIDSESWENCEPILRRETIRDIKSETTYLVRHSERITTNKDDIREFNSEVKRSDEDCVKQYTSFERRISYIQRNTFGYAGIEAAKRLSIICNNNGRKNKTERSIMNSVLSTAKNTNSGWPFFKRKNSNYCIKNTIDWMNNIFDKPNFYSLMKNPLMSMPMSLFHRVQPSIDEENKTANIKIRQVWCVPQRVVALEHYFFNDILERVYSNNKNNSSPIYSSGLTNLEISEDIVSRIRNVFKTSRNQSVYSLDYSKYDRTIPSFAIDLFFSICKEELDLNHKESKLYDILRLYTKNTPFCFDGKLYFKRKGISSGSFITNLFDTWWNLTLLILSNSIRNKYDHKEIMSIQNFLTDEVMKDLDLSNFDNRKVALCGDDCLLITDKYRVFIHVVLCNSLGMKVKQEFKINGHDENFFFLGRYWDFNNRPIQTDTYMLSHILLRNKWYKKEDLNFDISEYLQINRMLSIALPFYNGKSFLSRFFGNFNKLNDYIKNYGGFYLLKDYPLIGEYVFINRIDSESWTRF